MFLQFGRAWSVLGFVAVAFSTPVHAEDQALQAVLLKLQCVPSKVAPTKLAPRVVAYEVTCKGRPDALRILCHGEDCRRQSRHPEDNDVNDVAR